VVFTWLDAGGNPPASADHEVGHNATAMS